MVVGGCAWSQPCGLQFCVCGVTWPVVQRSETPLWRNLLVRDCNITSLTALLWSCSLENPEWLVHNLSGWKVRKTSQKGRGDWGEGQQPQQSVWVWCSVTTAPQQGMAGTLVQMAMVADSCWLGASCFLIVLAEVHLSIPPVKANRCQLTSACSHRSPQLSSFLLLSLSTWPELSCEFTWVQVMCLDNSGARICFAQPGAPNDFAFQKGAVS